MSKKLIPLLLFLVLLLPAAFAITQYPNIGGINGEFDLTFNNSKQGRFTKATTVNDVTVTSAVVNDPIAAPIVRDLDNNGTNEIIVIEEGRVKIFSGPNLEGRASITLTSNSFLTPHTFDVDNNGFIDIVLHEKSARTVYFVEYNGTDIINTSNTYSGGLIPASGMAQCGDTEECFIMATDSASAKTFWLRQFNKTDASSATNIFGPLSSFDMRPQQVPHVPIEDTDGDGTTDYYFAFNRQGGGGDDSDLYVYQVNSDSGFTPTLLFQHSGAGVVGIIDEAKYSGIILAEINGFANEKEIIFGEMTDTTGYRMFYYDLAGNQVADYPEFAFINQEAEGVILSNPFTGNFFPDTDVDFCLTGYNADADDTINLLCASETGSSSFFKGADKGNEWHYESAVPFNISANDPVDNVIYSPMAHAINHAQSSAAGSANEVDEILTPYGIFALDSFTFTRNELSVVYGISTAESAVIAADVENNGFQDLLFLTENNLFYHDDNFVNSQGQITAWTTNPCIDATIKVNQTLLVTITVEDVDGNSVSARADAYNGEPNEKTNNWSVNASSGTTFSFSYFLNETTSSSELLLFGRDTENADETPDTISLNFNVQENGVEQGDCVSSDTIALEEEDETIEEIILEGTGVGTQLNNNSIANSLSELESFSGLGTGIWFLLFMAVIAYVMMTLPGENIMIKFAGMIVVQGIMVVVGTILGFLDVGIVIILSLLIILAVGIGTFRMIFRSSSI